jgi:omega-amidase
MGAVKVTVVQMDIAWEDKQANFEKVRALLAKDPPGAGSLVALPEMFATGFSMSADAISETAGGPTEEFLASLAGEHNCWVIGGAAMRGKDGRARNKALVFSPAGRLEAYYAKMRPFSPGKEGEFYLAGKRTTVFGWSGLKVAPLICYDLRFPELFRKATAAHRPELFTVIASWPEKRHTHWVRLLQARAIENQAFVAGVNRTGADPFYTYAGHSVIIDPQGDILADAGSGEGIISSDLDVEGLRKYREGLPFLDDLA